MENIEASVLAKLKNKAKEQGIPLQQLKHKETVCFFDNLK